MKKVLAIIILVLLTMSAFYYTALADNVTVNVTVPQARTMTVPASVSLTAVVGSEATQNLSITGIKTNGAWTISVKKDSTYNAGLGNLYSPTATYTIPTSEFKFTSTGQGTPVQFLTTDQTVRTGTKTGETGASETVVYRLTTNYDDEAASDYAARHIYTIGP